MTLSFENSEAADLLEKADAAFGVQDFAVAADIYTQLIESGKYDAWSWFSIGRIYVTNNLREEAFICFKAAVRIDPNFFWAHYELVSLCQKFDIAVLTYFR